MSTSPRQHHHRTSQLLSLRRHSEGGSSQQQRHATKTSDEHETTTSRTNNRKVVSHRIQQLRRTLNPRSNKARWRYRTTTTDKIVEEEEDEELMQDADGSDHVSSSIAGGGEEESFSMDDSFQGDFASPADEDYQHGASDSAIRLTGAGGEDFQQHPSGIFRRANSTSPIESGRSGLQRIPVRGVSFDSEVLSQSSSHVIPTTSARSMDDNDHLTLRTFSSDLKEFRVKPHHCFPGNAAVYMTEPEIYKSMMNVSEHVEFLHSYVKPTLKTPPPPVVGTNKTVQDLYGTAKDRRLGSLRVEVLGCVGLSSVKPDVSVYLVCGDSAFATDTIHSCRSPMWPCNSKRAAVFPMHHAYVRLFVGVFGGRKEKNDEFLGRIVLDASALRPNTEYDVTFPLRLSSFVYDRRPRGVIRLRFSLHWFNERAVMLSYLKSPRSLSSESPDHAPSIPCGDPKTFRNVALTVHGHDLPGKYSQKAFRATMREFALTQLNLRFLVKGLAKDMILYEKPLFSLYIFSTWMLCVYHNSAKLAPSFFVGYLIMNMISNYYYFNLSEQNNLGYTPLTIQEMANSLVKDQDTGNMKPLLAKKKAKNIAARPAPSVPDRSHPSICEIEDIEPMDHREFPFSERHEYRKFTVDDALAYNKRTSSAKLASVPKLTRHRQLSIYVKNAPLVSGSSSSTPDISRKDEDDEDELEESDQDDDMTVSMNDDDDSVFFFDEADDEDMRDQPVAASNQRRIPLGPQQDSDQKPRKKIPPNIVLSRAEQRLHSFTGNISMDNIFHANFVLQAGREDDTSDQEPLVVPRRKGRRADFDDYDRRLGYRKRRTNPVAQVTSAFLGPIMRIIRVLVMIARVSFNIFAWKDPMLSFWALLVLIALMFVFLVFPWRGFLFLVGLGCFGPQNILLRKHLEVREAKKEEEEDAPSLADTNLDRIGSSQHSNPDSPSSTTSQEEQDVRNKKGPRRRLQNRIAQIKERRRLKRDESLDSLDETCPMRPPFSAHKPTKSTSRTNQLAPRELVVPYTRGRTERFYDWPPDPTVARATPISLSEIPRPLSTVEETWLANGSQRTVTTPEHGGDLRRRQFAISRTNYSS